MSVTTRTPTAVVPSEAAADFPIGIGQVYRVSVEQYKQMAAADILTKHDRLELLEGVLVAKMTIKPPHILGAKKTLRTLRVVAPAGWHVAKDDPIETIDSVPEPDCTVIRGVEEDYGDRLAAPQDVGLVVEVSDSTLRVDQTLMRRIYARAAIPFYWIVNIPDRRVEVYSDPTGPGDAPDYRQQHHYAPDDEVPFVLDGREVARVFARDLLP